MLPDVWAETAPESRRQKSETPQQRTVRGTRTLTFSITENPPRAFEFDGRQDTLRAMPDRLVARRRFLQGLTAVPALAAVQRTILGQSGSTHSKTSAARPGPQVSLNVR